jgi:hypothetical protein
MIFSHVLYQLSYLARKKPARAGEGAGGKTPEKPVLPALRPRPLPRAPRIGDRPETRRLHAVVSLSVFYVGNAAQLAAHRELIAGAGFEPATFGL